MKNILCVSVLLFLMPPLLQADWLEEVKSIHEEIAALTVNEQGQDDLSRLQRYYELSYDLCRSRRSLDRRLPMRRPGLRGPPWGPSWSWFCWPSASGCSRPATRWTMLTSPIATPPT